MAALLPLRLAAGPGRVLLALIPGWLLACSGSTGGEAPAEGEAAASAASPAPAKERSPERAEVTPARAPAHLMAEHLAATDRARAALVRGDLEAAHGPLAWLATHEPEAGSLPRGWERFVAAVRADAAAGQAAQTLPDGAEAVASIGRECGACHEAMGAGPAFGEVPLTVGGGFSTHMERHQWAADRMWEGLVQPDPDRWRAGAMVLLEDPLHELQAPGSAPSPEAVARLGQRLHDLGEDGLGVVEPAEQVALYGEILTACGTCHSATGGGPR